jgi:hypothetical protein
MKYEFLNKELKSKYERYTKFYLGGVIIGGLLVFNTETFGKFMELSGNTPFVMTWIGYILWVISIVFLILQVQVRNADKRRKAEVNRVLDEEEKRKVG